MRLFTLSAASILAIRFLIPDAEDLALLFLVPSILAAVPWPKIPTHWRVRASAINLGMMITSVLHILLYHRLVGLPFNIYQITDNPIDAVQSVILFFGPLGAWLMVLEFTATGLATAKLALSVNNLPRARSEQLVFYMLAIITAIFVGLRAKLLLSPPKPLALTFEGAQMLDPARKDESIIVLQLESLNGAVMFEHGEPTIPMPGLEKLKNMGGIWIPNFWATSFGTNLGMSSILCGSSGAMVAKLLSPTDGTPCLPERFRRAGFSTTFYYSFRDAEFYNMGDHVKNLGFENFYYGKDLMNQADSYWQWGYEDCKFYDRAFEHMRSTGLDKRRNSFIYMSVHMNHVPYVKRMPVAHPFAKPKNAKEEYLNSAFEQDYCLAKFLGKVEGLKRDDLHVLMVGDHSFPVARDFDLRGQYTTSFYFLPAKTRRSEFAGSGSVEVSSAQDQILSTVLDLFGAPASDASFLWALQGHPQPITYRDCHMISFFGDDMGFAVQGDKIVLRKIRAGKFYGAKIVNERVGPLKEIHTLSDWSAFQLPAACMARLGAPTI